MKKRYGNHHHELGQVIFWDPPGARLPENNYHLTERQALYISCDQEDQHGSGI